MKKTIIFILFFVSSLSYANPTWELKEGAKIIAIKSIPLLPEDTEYYFVGNKVYPSSEFDLDIETLGLYCFLVVSGGHKSLVPNNTVFTTYFSTQNRSTGDVAVALSSLPRVSFISAIACRDKGSYQVPTLFAVKKNLKHFFRIVD